MTALRAMACTLFAVSLFGLAFAQKSEQQQKSDPQQQKSDQPQGGAAQGGTAKPGEAPVVGRAVLGVTVAEAELVAKGHRASKLLKSEVYNDSGDKIGEIDDLVISSDGKVSVAIVEVSRFLGLKRHRVAIPVQQFTALYPKVVLPGATKQALQALPKFEYLA